MKIKIPLNVLEVRSSKLCIGDYLSITRKFTDEDVWLFAEACQDPYATHWNSDDGSFFVKGLVYGHLVTSIFTASYRSHFPKPILLQQDFSFQKPVFVGEEVEGISEVEEIWSEKKIVTFKTRVIKVNSKEQVIKGQAKLIIPTLVV